MPRRLKFKSIITTLILQICLAQIFQNTTIAQNNIQISEIMYDLEGTDTDREWVEIQNNSETEINLTNWRFEEDNIQHTLTLKQGSLILEPNGLAIIVDNYDKFKSDYPSYTKTILDSSFSLVNTTETIKLRSSQDGDVAAEVAYSKDMGASGDKNSLQFFQNTWIAALPTPGETNSNIQAPSPTPSPQAQVAAKTPTLSPKASPTASSMPSKSPTSANKTSSSVSSNVAKNIDVNQTSTKEVLGDTSPKTEELEPEATKSEQVPKAKLALIIGSSGMVLLLLSIGLYVWYSKSLGSNNKKILGSEKESDQTDTS